MDYHTFDKAEELLLTKEVSDLTHEERALLSEQFGSMEQATEYREFLLLAREELSPMNESVPEPDVLTTVRVKARMRALKHENESSRNWWKTLFDLLNYRVRLYQSGIAMLVVVAVMFFLTNKSNNRQSVHTDTLYADSSAVKSIDMNDTVVGGN